METPVAHLEDLAACRRHDPASCWNLWVLFVPGGEAYNVASHPNAAGLDESKRMYAGYAYAYTMEWGGSGRFTGEWVRFG